MFNYHDSLATVFADLILKTE